jgi:DNA-binding YbaB/EbfC family protein
MSSAFGEFGSLLKQAQEMQRELDRVREELRNTTVEGSAGAGAVVVTVTGDRNVASISISPAALEQADKALLEDLILSALRDGNARAAKLAEERLGKVTGGVRLPGLF